MQNLLIFLHGAIGIAQIRYNAYIHVCTSYVQYMYHQVSHRNVSIGHRCVYHSNIRISYANIRIPISAFVDIPSQKRCSFDLFFVENERESRLYTMNSHQFSLVLLNIIAASSCFGLETIEFSSVLFLSCMSNQASSVRSIYLPPLKYRIFSIFMIEVCKKKLSAPFGVHLRCYLHQIAVHVRQSYLHHLVFM